MNENNDNLFSFIICIAPEKNHSGQPNREHHRRRKALQNLSQRCRFNKIMQCVQQEIVTLEEYDDTKHDIYLYG